MTNLIARLQVIATAAVTWLTALAVALTSVAGQLGEIGDVPPEVTQWIARAVVWLLFAVSIIRRVMPVAANQRGVLPKDRGSIDPTQVLVIVILALLIVFLVRQI